MGYDAEHVRQKRASWPNTFSRARQPRQKARGRENTALRGLPGFFGRFIPIEVAVPDVVPASAGRRHVDGQPLYDRLASSDPPLRGPEEPNKHVAYARFWADQVNNMLSFEAAHPDRCVRLRNEDLVGSTEPELRRVFAGLGEPWSPEVLTYYNKQHDLGRGDRKALIQKGIRASLDNWHALDESLVEQLAAIVRKPATQLGYTNLSKECRQLSDQRSAPQCEVSV